MKQKISMLVYRKSATTIGTLLWIIRLILIVACLSINDAYWGKTIAETICFFRVFAFRGQQLSQTFVPE